MRKKLLLLSLFAAATSLGNAQSFSDDFESYNVGAKLGPQSPNWTTWSNADGGAEDVNVVSTDAHSGTKSIYFSSTSATGGPADVVLPFGGVNSIGQFEFKSQFKVPANKTAYFNFQANAIIGQVWALECFMNADGSMTFGNTSGQFLATTYPQGTWFELRLAVNFNTNRWEVFVDSVSKGFFSNTVNQIASLDIYPANAQASFWMDDVAYVITPFTLPTLNASAQALNINNGLVGQTRKPSVVIRNLGLNAITSFDLALSYNGTTINKNVTGVNIASLANYTYKFSDEITLVSGSNDATITVSNVNGLGADGDSTDNFTSISLSPVAAAAGRVVVGEEATGTWCQWCPRGAVFMDYMEESYKGYFAGIAVHNNDPMVYTPYDNAIGALVPGYPSALVNRVTAIDPSDLEVDFMQSIVNAPEVVLKNGATYDPATRQLKVSISHTTQQAISGNYTVACVLTEDSVKGTGSGYNQVNAYSGGANGVMGGFELLPNPVPAATMVYDHVARIIVPSFAGYQNAFGASTDSGITTVYTYTFVLPTNWKAEKINIIGMVMDPNGYVANGSTSRIDAAVANGYVMGTEIGGNTVGFTKFSGPDALQLHPNPAGDYTNLSITLQSTTDVVMEIFNINGQKVAERNYGQLNGSLVLPINTSELEAGLYLVKLNAGSESQITKLIVH